MFVDETGFYQLPAAVRTWAPRGETPELRAPLNYDNLSTISGITITGTARAGKLYMHTYEQPISRKEAVSFLRHVLRRGASRRLHLEQLPGYAPDLNPDEGVWNYLRNVEMKNPCCQGLDHLKTELRKAKERLRHKTQIIKSFFQEVELV